MKKLLFSILLLVAASVTICAQDVLVQTEPPVITVQGADIDLYPDVLNVQTTVFIENAIEDSDADIYYAIADQWGNLNEGWMIYNEPISFYPGQYTVMAYAQAPGKAPSEVVNITFYAVALPELVYLYDFIVDGIYYRYRGNDELWVTTEGLESHDYNPWPHPYSLCYSGDVVIPESVEYEGKTYRVTGIYHEAFWGCKVTSLDLPSTMTEIGEWNFNSSDDPKYFVCRAITPPRVAENYYGNQPDAVCSCRITTGLPQPPRVAPFRAHHAIPGRWPWRCEWRWHYQRQRRDWPD